VLVLYRAFLSAKNASAPAISSPRPGDAAPSLGGSSSEEVTELIQRHMNYFPELEAAAEELWRSAKLDGDDAHSRLVRHLQDVHGVQVSIERGPARERFLRHYNPERRILSLSELLPTRSRKMQLAHQIGLLSQGSVLDRLTDTPILSTPESKLLARSALCNYFAAAALMPYEPFRQAAGEMRYDLEVLGRRFGTGFEQVAHRLTTLRRPEASGVPFHMLRIDVAGNISKRFSASGFPIPSFSGACPRWNIFAAFSTPGMLRVQLSRLPDGSAYFCIARTVQADSQGYHAPPRIHAIGLGCAVEHARELVYADGLDLQKLDAAVPVGVSCRLCERTSCEQRAFPPLGRPLALDANVRGVTLYASIERRSGAAPSGPKGGT
jgi:predicted transcriptional regulator